MGNVPIETVEEQRTGGPAGPAVDVPAGRGPRRWRGPLAIVIGVLAGIGLTFGVPALLSDDDAPSDPDLALDGGEDSADLLADVDTAVPPGAGAESAPDAVEGFLSAEAAGDYERSFGYLSSADRQEFRSTAGWVAAHASVIAPIESFELGEVEELEREGRVASVVRYEPGIDPVIGLIPGRSRVVWVAVADDQGSWGVDLASSTQEPQYPSDTAAPEAARTWAESHLRCDDDIAAQRDGTVIGSPSLADALCGAGGTVTVGPVAPLDDLDSAPFTTAFGGDALTWARVVPVTSPVELRAVLAPIGDDWIVVGVLS